MWLIGVGLLSHLKNELIAFLETYLFNILSLVLGHVHKYDAVFLPTVNILTLC